MRGTADRITTLLAWALYHEETLGLPAKFRDMPPDMREALNAKARRLLTINGRKQVRAANIRKKKKPVAPPGVAFG